MKGLFILLLFLLVGCHHDPWKNTSIYSSSSQYTLARLSYPPSNPNKGIELEMTRLGEEVYAYVNVYQYTFPPKDSQLDKTTLTIHTEETAETFVLPLMEGGQRVRLTDPCLHHLLLSLSTHSTITLSSGHFSQVINTKNFKNHYKALLHKPSFIRPQNLINFELY